MVLNSCGFKHGWISLNEPRCVYYSGQIIFGAVNFDLAEDTKIFTFNIAHLGEADVQWDDDQSEIYSTLKPRNKIHYTGHEQIFYYLHCVIGLDGETVLRGGSHSIPFAFQLPFTAPSSFSHDKGYVRYTITAYLLRDNEYKEELIREYKVVAPLDSEKHEYYAKPISLQLEDVQCSNWFCKPRALSIRVDAPRTGYSPGEFIPVTVNAVNNSNLEVSKIMLMLTVKERYHSNRPMSTYTGPDEVLETKELQPIPGRSEQSYQTHIKVPLMIAPNLENCKIIDIAYFFKVKIQTAAFFKSLEDEAEICIGVLPLNDFGPHPLSDSLPVAPIPDPSTSTTFVEGQNIGAHFAPKFVVGTHMSKHNLAPRCPSDSYVSIADLVDENVRGRSIDLYTSYEMGFKSKHIPSSMLPTKKSDITFSPIPSLSQHNKKITQYKSGTSY